MKTTLLFLTEHFPDLLETSLTASVVILFVILARQLLKRAPKIFSYALWSIVLLRLLVPISIESPVSFVPERTELSGMVDVNTALPEIQFETPQDRADNTWHQENTAPGESLVQTYHSVNAQTYLTFAWLVGIACMLLHSAVSYWKLRKKVRVAVLFQKGIYIADDIDTPFVMGFLRPAVYLPGTLEPSERKYIIAHERHHIRRGDHIFKALGFLALTLHWFNPLVWVAFILASRDMEMSCDEAVIRKLGGDVRAEYSASLLNLATGHRLFAGTPLAFGEGDPTGRVRNLAKWKKPALWVLILCVVLCAVLAVCLLTDPAADSPDEPNAESETQPTESEETTPAEAEDWGISLVPNRVSRTSAEAIFSYPSPRPGYESAKFTYGDFLCLERLENGTWVPVEELPGYGYSVGNSSYPVRDGDGMFHDWTTRFGELPDGHYRLGKSVTMKYPGRQSEERIIYGEFTLPDSILTGPIPLEELPEVYGAEQAMLDGCFVQIDGVAQENQALFREFATNSLNGIPGSIRVYNYSSGADRRWSAVDLSFDGSVYTVTGLDGSYSYRYLKHYTGEKAWENADHDAFEYYVLANDDSLTWEVFSSGLLNGQEGGLAHWTVFAEFTYLPDRPQLPAELEKAVLEFEGQPLITVTDSERLEKIHLLFSEAEFLGYEPKTHSIGVELNLVLTSPSGETVTLELDPENDLCRIGSEYAHYGAFDEPSYVYKLWDYLGITAWPETFYEKYPNTPMP